MNLPPCLNCGSGNVLHYADARDVEYYSTPDSYSYYRCSDCNVLFIHPVPSDQLSVIYPPNYYSFSGSTSIAHKIKTHLDRRLFKSLLRRIHSSSINVLDVGGGSGWLLDIIKGCDPRVNITHVVDIDKNAEQVALQNGHRYFCGRIEEFDGKEKFDIILLLNLIEHVKSPLNVLVKLKNILSSQGIVLVKTPNYESLDARLFKKKNWGGYHCPRHWVLFEKKSFLQLAQKAGFMSIHFRYTQGASFWTISVLHLLNKYHIIRITQDSPVFNHPLYPLVSIFFAVFDFFRRPFSKTSQMFITLTPSTSSSP